MGGGRMHEQIRPQAHVATWAISVLMVILAATLGTTNDITNATEVYTAPDGTKKYFTYEGSGGFKAPDACLKPTAEQQVQIDQITVLKKELLVLQEKDTSQFTAEEKAAHEAKIQELLTKIKTAAGTVSTVKPGPTAECKAAVVAGNIKLMTAQLEQTKSKLIVSVDNVSAKIIKVEDAIANIKPTTENQPILTAITADINAAKLNLAILSDFLTKTQSQMESFLTLSKTDPNKAYDSIRTFRVGGDNLKATKASEGIISAFTSLKANIERLIELTEGSNGNI